MKRILTVLSLIALASSLTVPVFAKAKISKQAPKAHEATSTTAKTRKNRKHHKHARKSAAKTNPGSTAPSHE